MFSFLYNITPIVKKLLIVNIVVFILFYLLKNIEINILSDYALRYPASSFFKPVQLVTNMFLHDGFWHLALNMLALVSIGSMIESLWGAKKFLIYYLTTGIGAGIIHISSIYVEIQILKSSVGPQIWGTITTNGLNNIMYNPSIIESLEAAEKLSLLVNTPSLGASGALFGLLTAFGMLFPNAQLMLLIPPIPIKAKYMAVIALITSVAIGYLFNINIGHFAHLGGMIFGFLLIQIWRKKGTYL